MGRRLKHISQNFRYFFNTPIKIQHLSLLFTTVHARSPGEANFRPATKK